MDWETLVKEHLPLVGQVYWKFFRRWHEHRADLMQEGAVALVMFAKKFDPEVVPVFEAVACNRIKWRMQDWLRWEGIHARSEARRAVVNLKDSQLVEMPAPEVTPLDPEARFEFETETDQAYYLRRLVPDAVQVLKTMKPPPPPPPERKVPLKVARHDPTVREDEILSFDEEKRRIAVRALDAAGGNVHKAAKLLKVGRATMYRWIEVYNLS